MECELTQGSFVVEVYVGRKLRSVHNLDISGGGDLYGTFKYGDGTKYASRQQMAIPVDLPVEADGRTFHLRAIYTGKRRFRWFGFFVPTVVEPAITGDIY